MLSNADSQHYLSFENLVGTDCLGVEDLLLVDADTLAFKCGKFLYFFKINTKTLTSLKRTDGNIGAITRNKINNHLAIAENGTESKICIHSYPSMELVKVCSGERKELAHLSYSCSGELLASQSNAPEFAVTIWNWQTATILLQFENNQISDNFDLQFAVKNDRFMYTGGAKHLHFWDIVRTFTGLKLLHNIGRFGKFKSCDILTVCPDGARLLTNCDWGNVLVWENGKIKFEVCRKNRQPCHSAPITQITLCNEYLYTIGMDNFVRIWFWDTVAIGELRQNEKIIEFEAVYEYEIKSSIRSPDDLLTFTIDPENEQFSYIHDGNGVIWKSVTDSDFTSHSLQAIFRASSKNLIALVMSPISTFLITLDVRGVLCLYNYRSGAMVFHHRFLVAANSVLWCGKQVDASGKTVIFGFSDGSFRVTCFDVDETNWSGSSINTIQYLKPHTGAVSAFYENANTLVSASDDQTIFIYTIAHGKNGVYLDPIGFVPVDMEIRQISMFVCTPDQQMLIVVGKSCGYFLEIPYSNKMKSSGTSYLLQDATNSITMVEIPEGDSGTSIILSASIANSLILLLSNCFLYEYNICTKIFTTLHDCGQICSFIIYSNEYVILCLNGGQISIARIDTMNPMKISTICSLVMPHEFHTESIYMRFSWETGNLIIANAGGSILCYKWKMTANMNDIQYVYTKCTIEHRFIDEKSTAFAHSLEQQKQCELENVRKIEVQQRKAATLEKIAQLKNEFMTIKDRNSQLPNKFQLNSSAFEIDERITVDLERSAQQKFKVIQMELQKKIDRIRSQAERMEHVYLDNLEHWPITLTGFRNKKTVETFLIYEINDEFQALKVQFDARELTLEISNSSASIENNLIEQKELSYSTPLTDKSCDSLTQANEFISAIAEKIDSNQVDIQTKRLYNRYVARKQQDIERKKQWKRIELTEPRASCSKSSDDNLRSIAAAGDATADFEIQTNQTILDKYRMLKALKHQMTRIKREFNAKVLKLQDEKLHKCTLLTEQIAQFQEISKKLNPDNDIMIDVGEVEEKLIQFNGKCFKEILINVKDFQSKLHPCDELSEKHSVDIWRAELHRDQVQMFTQIECIYQDFDDKIDDISEQSLEISLKIQFMELYYFVLYQELLVLNRFEEPHKSLLKSIDSTTDKMRKLDDELKLWKHKLKEHLGDDALADTNGKLIEVDLLFKGNESAVAEQQQQILEQVAALPMSSSESKTIKPLIESMNALLLEWIAFDKDLKGDKYALQKMLDERETQLDDIDVVILLPEDRFSALKPSETKSFENCVLVNKNNMSKINEQINEYETETLNEFAKQKSLQLQLNQIKSTCTKINTDINSLRAQMNDKMLKKFGMHVDFDEMEETILMRLLTNQTKCDADAKLRENEVRRLTNILETKNKELLLLKQQQIEKYNMLLVLQAELNAINDEQRYHDKLRSKYLLAAENKAKDEKDFERLLSISKHQKEQLKKITKDIQTLRLKIKPQDQFLLNERAAQERTSPQILTFPSYILDACEDSPRTPGTNSYSTNASARSQASVTSQDTV